MELSEIFQKIINWIVTVGIYRGIRVFLIFIVAYFLIIVIKKFIRRKIKKITIKHESTQAKLKREVTLIQIFNGVLKIVIWIIAIMMILSEFGLNLTPILTGIGILGLAIGFGAQHIVRDFLAGFFIMIENQYRVGDTICLDKTCGRVESFSLRKTVLRNLDGVQEIIPNGEIRKVSNLSKEFSRIHLNIGVAYKENLEKVINILNEVGLEMVKEAEWEKTFILEPLTNSRAPKVLGVDAFADSAIIIKIVGRVKPSRQWAASRELRKRIKIAFDRQGIEIPFPQMSIWPRGSWKS